MTLTFLSGLGAFAKENGVALLCLIFLSLAVWRVLAWTAKNIILPLVKRILELFDVAETVFVAMGHDVAELKSKGCGAARAASGEPTAASPPQPPQTLQLTAAH